MFKRCFYSIFILTAIIFFSVLTCNARDVLNKENLGFIRAIVDDEIITQNEVLRHSAEAVREARKKYTNDREFAKKINDILEESLEELINRKLLVKEANRLYGTDMTVMESVEKELDYFLESAVESVGSLSKYYEIAESQGVNPIEKKAEIREDIMIDKIMDENVYNKVLIQPRAMKRYYRENIDEFRQKKELKAKHIMIKFSAYGSKKEAYTLAKKIMMLIEKGEDFSELARQYSDGPNAQEGGVWNLEEIEGLREDLRDVINNLGENEYSDIVESPIGYHIFKVEIIKPEKIRTFEEVQDEIYQKLYREKISGLKDEYIQELREDAFIRIIKY